MRTSILLFAFIPLFFILAGCREATEPITNEDINITMAVNPEAPTVGDATLVVTVTDADGNPIEDATVDIRGDMNHAGMVPVLREVEGGEEGIYEIPFEWTMGGDWIVTVGVVLPDGAEASAQYEYTVAGAMDMDDMDMGDDSDMDMNMDDMDMGDDSDMDMNMDDTESDISGGNSGNEAPEVNQESE